jgi:CrcB protein
MIWLWVMIGGALGAGGRYLISGVAASWFGETFPWGTVVVNVLGSLLIGLIFVATGPDSRLLVSPEVRQFLMTGILGGFTTYSSFSLQTLTLAQDGEYFRAGANVLLTLVLCLAGCWLGMILGQTLNQGNLHA